MVKRYVKLTVGSTTRVVDLATGGAPSPETVTNVTLPTITGTMRVGQTVTANPGTWNVTPDSFAFVWRRNGVAIPGASGSTYLLQAADEGTNTVSVTVSAFKVNYLPGAAASAPITVLPPAVVTEGLWFEYPAEAETSPKLALAHFFPQFPLALTTNVAGDDYYENNYLSINGESGQHASYGGFLRDRPIKIGAPWSTTPSWQVNACREEIENAIKFKVNGFVVDIITKNGHQWTFANAVFDAASTVVAGERVYPNFVVIPMIDGDGSFAGLGANQVAADIDVMLSKAAAYRLPNGNYVVASYRPESQSTTFWNDLRNRLQTAHGKTVVFWHAFLEINSASTFASSGGAQAVTGRWGTGADPVNIAAVSTSWVTQARSRGEDGVLFPVWYQDVRPSTGHGRKYDEAVNTACLRGHWDRAIGVDAEHVQLCTWSDYSEGSGFAPTRKHGEAVLALNAWYMARWKTGVFPAILQDAVFVTHRAQREYSTYTGGASGSTSPTTEDPAPINPTTTITGGQTLFMTHATNRSPRSPRSNKVEVVTFLTAADTVTVNIGGNEYNYNAPAGMFVWSQESTTGTVTVSTGRGVNVTSPYTIRSSSANEDKDYCWAYSLDSIPVGSTPATRGNPTPA